MLKLSKRCKSLVVSLLLCGCLVGFSSVSAFAVNDTFVGKTWISTVDQPWTGKYQVRFSCVTTFPETDLIVANTNTSDDYSLYKTTAYDYYTYILTNISEEDAVIGNYVQYIQSNQGNITTLDAGATWRGGKSTQIVEHSQNVWSIGINSSGTASSQIAFQLVPNYKGNYLLPAGESIEISFCIKRVFYFKLSPSRQPDVRSNYFGQVVLDQAGLSDFFYNYPSNTSWIEHGIIVTDPTVTGGESAINDSLQSQIEQQQQQHEEQMEQSQQQYDDFTNDGNSPGGDGISGSDFVGGSRDEVNDKLGFFEIINYTIQGVLGVFNADAILTDTTITLPGFEIPIRSTDPNTGMATSTTYTVWQNTEYDLGQELNTNFGSLMTVVRFATSVVVLFGLINYIIKVYHRILGIPRG